MGFFSQEINNRNKKMKIEVTWKVKPQSGITIIDLSEFGVKNKKIWDSLPKKQQEQILNDALEIYDGGELKALATEW